MKFLVLGLTGKRGSGKDTAAFHLRDKYGFQILTYTDHVLTPILEKKYKEVTRENLINLALEMRKEKGNHILTELICRKIGKEGFWVVSGVRYPEEYEYFKGQFLEGFKMINVGCEAKKRYERTKKRGTKGEADMTFKDFMDIEKKETEKVIDETITHAQFSVDNNGTIGELQKSLDKVVEKLGISKSP